MNLSVPSDILKAAQGKPYLCHKYIRAYSSITSSPYTKNVRTRGESRKAGPSPFLPQTPPPAPAPATPGRGAAAPRRAHAAVRPRTPGGGLPGGPSVGSCVSVSACVRACPASAAWRGRGGRGGNPPGRLWGRSELASRARSRGGGAGPPERPVVLSLSDLLEFCSRGLFLGGRRHPSGTCRARLGGGRRPLPSNKTRTTLSGGSLGSCVDEERS